MRRGYYLLMGVVALAATVQLASAEGKYAPPDGGGAPAKKDAEEDADDSMEVKPDKAGKGAKGWEKDLEIMRKLPLVKNPRMLKSEHYQAMRTGSLGEIKYVTTSPARNCTPGMGITFASTFTVKIKVLGLRSTVDPWSAELLPGRVSYIGKTRLMDINFGSRKMDPKIRIKPDIESQMQRYLAEFGWDKFLEGQCVGETRTLLIPSNDEHVNLAPEGELRTFPGPGIFVLFTVHKITEYMLQNFARKLEQEILWFFFHVKGKPKAKSFVMEVLTTKPDKKKSIFPEVCRQIMETWTVHPCTLFYGFEPAIRDTMIAEFQALEKKGGIPGIVEPDAEVDALVTHFEAKYGLEDDDLAEDDISDVIDDFDKETLATKEVGDVEEVILDEDSEGSQNATHHTNKDEM